MGDEDEGPGELEQALLQHLERRDVEVVRGLVEQQQVGRLQHEASQHRAGLLAAREPSHRRLELLGAEEEAPRPARHVHAAALEDDRVAVGGERALQRDRGVEPRAVLVEHHHPQARGVLDRARVGRLLPAEQAQERALAAAVRPEEAEAGPRREHEVEAAHDLAVAVALRQTLGDHQALRLPLGRGEVEVHGRGLRARVEVRELVLQPLRPRRSAPAPCGCGRGPCARASRARPARGFGATPGRPPARPGARPSSPGSGCSARARRGGPRRRRG